MKNNSKIEIYIVSVLTVLAILILNPLHVWMPTMMHISILGLTLVVCAYVAIFMVREKVVDERDMAHRMLAGRVAFMIGSILLITGIIIQSWQGTVDGWLIVVLISMIISKLVTRMYSDTRL